MIKKIMVPLSGLILIAVILIMGNGQLFSCTMFTIDTGRTILVANNEDDITPFTEIRIIPATSGKYGCFYLAFKDIQGIQSAMNEKGLIFDIFMAPRQKLQHSKGKKKCSADELYMKIMEDCATIDEVINSLDRFNLEFLEQIQLMFVDSSGDWAIVEGDNILRKKENSPFQVITNFYHSQLKKGDEIPCQRYKMAQEMLSRYQQQNDISIEKCRKILAAVHQEWRIGGTLYSNIYDLKRRRIYLYHFHNFENVIIMNLDNELKKGKQTIALSSLFPRTFAAEQHRERYIAGNRVAIVLDPTLTDRYLGEYQFESGRIISIIKEKRIFYVGRNRQKYEILPESKTKFFFKDFNMLINFIKDKQGMVTDMILHYDKDMKLKKIR